MNRNNEALVRTPDPLLRRPKLKNQQFYDAFDFDLSLVLVLCIFGNLCHTMEPDFVSLVFKFYLPYRILYSSSCFHKSYLCLCKSNTGNTALTDMPP